MKFFSLFVWWFEFLSYVCGVKGRGRQPCHLPRVPMTEERSELKQRPKEIGSESRPTEETR